jgi:hypothetical protein
MRDRRLGRHAALDQAGGRGRLQHHTGAGPAGQLRAPGHEGPELGRDHVQPPGGVAADLDQRALAAGAGGRLRHQHLLDLRQMRGQAAATGPATLRLLLRAAGDRLPASVVFSASVASIGTVNLSPSSQARWQAEDDAGRDFRLPQQPC